MASSTHTHSKPLPSARRPKLMRASATAPSLATSNASRNDLACIQNSRAATLLTRVAGYSAKQPYERTHSVCSSPGDIDRTPPSSAGSERKGSGSFEVGVQQCGNYYSFPSFEDFQEYLEHEHDHEERARDVT